ncbi:hypothetical protein MRX96_003949 [Rhipicephalus microplus]
MGLLRGTRDLVIARALTSSGRVCVAALCESCRESADLERRQSQQGTVLVRRVSSQEAEATAKRPRLDERRQRRARRGDRSVHMRATQTLMDLKIKVMELFSVAPFDQHLSLDQGDGQPPLSLSGNSYTLAELGVLPGALLLLVIATSLAETCLPEWVLKVPSFRSENRKFLRRMRPLFSVGGGESCLAVASL